MNDEICIIESKIYWTRRRIKQFLVSVIILAIISGIGLYKSYTSERQLTPEMRAYNSETDHLKTLTSVIKSLDSTKSQMYNSYPSEKEIIENTLNHFSVLKKESEEKISAMGNVDKKKASRLENNRVFGWTFGMLLGLSAIVILFIMVFQFIAQGFRYLKLSRLKASLQPKGPVCYS